MGTQSGIDLNDIFTELMTRIEENLFDDAMVFLRALPQDKNIGILYSISLEIQKNLVRGFDSETNLLDKITFSRDIVHKLANELRAIESAMQARDYFEIAESDISPEFYIDMYFSRAYNSTTYLARLLDLIDTDDLSLLSVLKHSEKQSRFIAYALEELMGKRSADTTTLILDGVERLTPSVLMTIVAPYLQAVADLERIFAEMKGISYLESQIRSITKFNPTSIVFSSGLGEALGAIRELVEPWRRKHARKMAEHAEQEKQAQIAKLQAEVLAERARADQTRQESKLKAQEVEQMAFQAERMRLENEKLRLEILEAKTELAFAIVNREMPDAPSSQRLPYVMQVLQTLDSLINTPVRLTN